jgi:hypothetical protein
MMVTEREAGVDCESNQKMKKTSQKREIKTELPEEKSKGCRGKMSRRRKWASRILRSSFILE